MSTRGPSSRPTSVHPRPLRPSAVRSLARRLALEPPGWLFSIHGAERGVIIRRQLAVDDPDQLLGLVADDDWSALALVLPGSARPVDPVDDPDREATLAYVVDRRGHHSLAVRSGGPDGRVESMADASGFIADVAGRILGLPSAPEPTTSALLVVSVWLQNLLDATADPGGARTIVRWSDAVGQHPAWRAGGGPLQIPADDGPHPPDDVAELTLGLGRQLTWERMRRLAADGAIVIPGLAASEAAWMDAPFFARWTLGVHRPVTELLDDLSLFIDGGVLRDVRYTVDAVGWLGFADSHAS